MADIRYLILCDEVEADTANVLRFNVRGLITHIRSTAIPPFPVLRPLFSVLVILTDCRGEAELSLRIVQGETGRTVFRNQPRRVRFAGAAPQAVGITFRIRNCSFPAAGLYYVEFPDFGEVKAAQPLSLTS